MKFEMRKEKYKILSLIILWILFVGVGFWRVSSIQQESSISSTNSVVDKIKNNNTEKENVSLPDPQVKNTIPFTDIQSHQYKESIEFLQSLWVVKWYPDGSYGPDRTVTRAEMMKIILESAVWVSVWSSNNCFPDVSTERYAKYICYGNDKWIVRGYPNGTFWPNNTVTFAEWLKITLESYDAPVSEWTWREWYLPYIDFVHNNNLFSKYALYPDNTMTRGEMAYLAHQLYLEKKWLIQFKNQRSYFSAWCGNTPPGKVPNQSVVNWQTRNYITVVWNKYNKNTPTKLIFAFHGRTNSNAQVQQYYWIDKASWWNAIIVYPLWLPEWWPSRSWNTNFAIFDTLYEEFTNNYCVDLDEVYVMGHSLGAWYSNTLACARGDLIRASWTVWWSITPKECRWPTASLIMHNPEDRLASFSSGEFARDKLVQNNQCGPETKKVWPSRWNCVEYTNCISDAPVVWCPHSDSTAWNWTYYPHTWPTGAAQEIWKFFTTHE